MSDKQQEADLAKAVEDLDENCVHGYMENNDNGPDWHRLRRDCECAKSILHKKLIR